MVELLHPKALDDVIGISKCINCGWFDCNFSLFKEQFLNKILRVIHV